MWPSNWDLWSRIRIILLLDLQITFIFFLHIRLFINRVHIGGAESHQTEMSKNRNDNAYLYWVALFMSCSSGFMRKEEILSGGKHINRDDRKYTHSGTFTPNLTMVSTDVQLLNSFLVYNSVSAERLNGVVGWEAAKQIETCRLKTIWIMSINNGAEIICSTKQKFWNMTLFDPLLEALEDGCRL